jgi:hypothetical protein
MRLLVTSCIRSAQRAARRFVTIVAVIARTLHDSCNRRPTATRFGGVLACARLTERRLFREGPWRRTIAIWPRCCFTEFSPAASNGSRFSTRQDQPESAPGHQELRRTGIRVSRDLKRGAQFVTNLLLGSHRRARIVLLARIAFGGRPHQATQCPCILLVGFAAIVPSL